jgi:hypothetical protein
LGGFAVGIGLLSMGSHLAILFVAASLSGWVWAQGWTLLRIYEMEGEFVVFLVGNRINEPSKHHKRILILYLEAYAQANDTEHCLYELILTAV